MACFLRAVAAFGCSCTIVSLFSPSLSQPFNPRHCLDSMLKFCVNSKNKFSFMR